MFWYSSLPPYSQIFGKIALSYPCGFFWLQNVCWNIFLSGNMYSDRTERYNVVKKINSLNSSLNSNSSVNRYFWNFSSHRIISTYSQKTNIHIAQHISVYTHVFYKIRYFTLFRNVCYCSLNSRPATLIYLSRTDLSMFWIISWFNWSFVFIFYRFIILWWMIIGNLKRRAKELKKLTVMVKKLH